MTITKSTIMERVMEYGTVSANNEEIVVAISGVSIEVLRDLIETHGDLHGALKCARPKRGYLTKKQAMSLNMLFEFYRRTIKDDVGREQFTHPTIIFNKFKREMESYDSEHLFLLALNSKNQLIKKVLLTKGIKNASLFHEGEAIRQAILLNANSMMLIHNHPSGISKPSQPDIDITERLKAAGELVRIKMLDHIVFGKDEYTSIHEIIGL